MGPSGAAKVRVMSNEGFQAKAHRVVGEFILSMAKTEFAMDEFIWTTSNLFPDHLETANYNGHKFADTPPTSINGKIELIKHFHSKIISLQELEDKNGKIDIDQWMKDFKDIYDFRNNIAHGNVDAVIHKDGRIFLRAHKYPARKPWKISSYMIDVKDIALATTDLIFHRSGFRQAIKLVTSSMKE
jgi:hypothetical protein